MSGVQDRAARANVRVLRSTQDEITAGTMGFGGCSVDNGRRVMDAGFLLHPVRTLWYYLEQCKCTIVVLDTVTINTIKELELQFYNSPTAGHSIIVKYHLYFNTVMKPCTQKKSRLCSRQ